LLVVVNNMINLYVVEQEENDALVLVFDEDNLDKLIKNLFEREQDLVNEHFTKEEIYYGHYTLFCDLAPIYFKARLGYADLFDLEEFIEIYNDFFANDELKMIELTELEVEESRSEYIKNVIEKIGVDGLKEIKSAHLSFN
jgi:predicted ribosome quality control (RQC) complex YloA/Tae2 family protein